jgi:autoinducer 2-binding protein LuxP
MSHSFSTLNARITAKKGFLSYILSFFLFSSIALSTLDAEAASQDDLAALVNQPPVAIDVDVPKPIKIGVVYPGLQQSDYWQRSLVALESRLDRLQIPYELIVRFSKPHSQQDLQESQILDVLSHQPDYLVYTINSQRQKSVVEMLLQSQKPKVIIQNLTQPITEWRNIQPLIYIGFDHARGAKVLANYYKQTYPKGTEYGILFWDEGVVSDQRGLTFEREVSGFHTLKASYYTEASREKAKQATLDMLKEFPNLKYIYACATDVAMGALDALETIGRTDVSVNGWGGGKSELDALRQGKLDVVLMRMNDQNGIAMAEAIKMDLKGQEVPLVFSGAFEVLTQRMQPTEIDQYVEKAFVYSGRQ